MNSPVGSPPGIAAVGAASFFSDTGHEITTAILPSFLTATLHAGAAALGVIEGASDAPIGIAKIAAPHRQTTQPCAPAWLPAATWAPPLPGGAIGLATAVWQVAALRARSWISRGLRGPSRDALLATLAPAHTYGRAYGLERAWDSGQE